MTREDVLKTVGSWLDSSCDPDKNDVELIIKRVGIITDPTGRPQGTRFAIEAKACLALWDEMKSNRVQLVSVPLNPKAH